MVILNVQLMREERKCGIKTGDISERFAADHMEWDDEAEIDMDFDDSD